MKTKNETIKYLAAMLLMPGMLLGIEATAMAQPRPNPNTPAGSVQEKLRTKPNLWPTASVQGNCVPLTFQVANVGGSNSGSFKVTIAQSGKILQTFSVEGLKPKETRTLKYPQGVDRVTNLSGLYTVVVDSDNTVDELSEKDNKISIEAHCIR